MALTAKSIQRDLRKLGNADIARHSKRFFKTGPGEYSEGDRFLGIRVPILRTQAKRYRGLEVAEIESLLRSAYHEERLLALLLLVDRFNTADAAGQKDIFKRYLANTRYINNWDLVDTSAPAIVGGYLLRKNKQSLFDLAGSEHLWKRRIAIMACYTFIRERQFSVTLKISLCLLNDDEDLIHKAVGWMLREIGNRDFETENAFLAKHYHRMPRTMLRYAIEKFPPSKRKAYLAGRI